MTGIRSTTSWALVSQVKSQTVATVASLHNISVRAIYIFRLRNQKKKEVRSNREMSIWRHAPGWCGFISITGALPPPAFRSDSRVARWPGCGGPERMQGGGVGRYGLCRGTDTPIKVYKAVFKIILGATSIRCQALTSCPFPPPPKNCVSGLNGIIDVCAA